jgi:hypothetical protein
MSGINVTDDDGNTVVEGSIENDEGDLEIIIEKNETDQSEEELKQTLKILILEEEGEWSINE